MNPVQKHLFDTNFKDLEGSHLAGTIAVSDELINLGIMDFISSFQGQATAPSPADQPASSAPAAAPDPKALLALLDIKTLKFRSDKGKALLEVDVRLGSKKS